MVGKKNREPLLSIIILAYKSDEYIYETIDSILEQSYSNIEVIVAEDGSKEFDCEKVGRYFSEHLRSNIVRYAIYCNQTNMGTVKNINQAIGKAQGEYIKFIAGDDKLVDTQSCSNQISYLQNHSIEQLVVGDVAECTSEMVVVDTVGFRPCNAENLLEKKNKIKLLRYICRNNPALLATQACCFRKEFFALNGLFDERFLLIEDLPMMVKIINQGISFGYLPGVCVAHRGGGGLSTSNNPFDVKCNAYYNDLWKYYKLILMPLRKAIGIIYVSQRYRLCEFRLKYCHTKLENNSYISKVILVLKYLPAIIYYMITQVDRVWFYSKGQRTKV